MNYSTLILTSNRSLNDYLSTDSKQKPIQIYDWIKQVFNQYTSSLPKNHADYKIFLKETPTELIWQQLIENTLKNKHEDDLFTNLSVFTITSQAIEAYKMLIQWQIPTDYFSDKNIYLNYENQEFIKLKNKFDELCDKNNWLVVYKMANQVIEWIRQDKIKCPQEIFYAGFEAIIPQIDALFNVFKEKGISLKSLDSVAISKNHSSLNKKYFKFSDMQSEFFGVANWALERCQTLNFSEHLIKNSYPIGIIIDDLETHQDQLNEIFNQVFNVNHEKYNYHIAIGQPVDQFEPIQFALFLMRLYPHKILTFSEINYLIFNTNFQDSFEQRLLFESYLRKNKTKTRYKLDELYQILTHLEQNDENIPQDFKLMLEKFFEHYTHSRCSQKHSPQEWVNYFKMTLNIFEWQQLIENEKYKNQQKWKLDEKLNHIFSKLEEISTIFSAISLRDALNLLKRLASGYSLRPENNYAPVQVLSLMESQSIQFDELWLMNAHSQNYPSPPKANMFLPLDLQIKYQMPRATTENQFEFASKLIDNLLKNTNNDLNISYSEEINQQEFSPSYLILNKIKYKKHDIKSYKINQNNQQAFMKNMKAYYQQKILSEYQTEWKNEIFYSTDNEAPPLNIAELKHVNGGTGIFKDQASCPFKAFANFRLKLKKFEIPEDGIDSLERGSLVHTVLEHFWIKLLNFENLKKMMSDPNKIYYNQLFDSIFNQILEDKTGEIYQLEKSRINQLIYKWFEFELKRNLDFAIHSVEEKLFSTLHDIHINIKIDRMDYLLQVGKTLIIDYKTGETNKSNWKTPRMLEPQLPIYAILQSKNQQIAGITFAKVKNSEMKFDGIFNEEISTKDSLFKKNSRNFKEPLEELIEKWDSDLKEQANQFKNGYAKVDPKNELQCEYCNYKLLCRKK